MNNNPNHIRISPAKLEKTDGVVSIASHLIELLATGATAFTPLPALFRHFADVLITYRVFKHITNGLAVIASIFFAYNFFQHIDTGNYIYTVYQLAPFFATLATAGMIWLSPDESLLRVFYLMGIITYAWLGV